MAAPFSGVELAMRCEQSEHGESQLFIKYFAPFLPLVFKVNFIFLLIVKLNRTSIYFQKNFKTRCPKSANNVAAKNSLMTQRRPLRPTSKYKQFSV